MEEELNSQETSMPESLRGNNSDQNQIRHSSDQNSTYCDNVNSPVNNHTTDETEIVHLGKSLKMNAAHLFKLERKLIRQYGTQEHVNVCFLLKVTK